MKKYVFILISLITAFVFTRYAGNSIFIASTPKINRNYLANLQSQFRKNVNSISLAFSIKTKKNNNDTNVANNTQNTSNNNVNMAFSIDKPESIPANLFKSVSKGVSAYEGDSGEVVLKIDNKQVKAVEKEIEVNGRKIKIVSFVEQ